MRTSQLYLSTLKEAPADDAPASSRLWTRKFTLDNILDTYEAMLVCVPSAGTLEKLK